MTFAVLLGGDGSPSLAASYAGIGLSGAPLARGVALIGWPCAFCRGLSGWCVFCVCVCMSCGIPPPPLCL